MRRALVALGALVGLVALVALAREGDAPGVPPPASPTPAPSARFESRGAPSRDPASIRDVFRFADADGPTPRAPTPSARPEAGETGEVAVEAGPRLVGLVRRGRQVLAALAIGGEVVLARPGETVGGLTVLSIDEEGVRVRREDGGEVTLPLG